MTMRSKMRHRRNFFRPWFSPANAEPTHFMKIILPPTIHSQNMRIPNEFVRRFGNELSTSEATICVPDGRVWKLEMKKSENEVWFCKGWEEFVKYYSLSFGFFLVFNYEGNSRFSVVIFDSSATEIRYPRKLDPQKKASVVTKCGRKRPYSFDHCGNKTRSQKQKIEDEAEIIDIEDENALTHGKSGKSDRTGQEEIDSSRRHEKEKDWSGQGLSFKMRKTALSKRQRAMEAAQNFKLGNENISFTAIIKPPNLNRRYMDVPATFARAYMGKIDCVKLQDCNGKRWLVNCSKRASSSRVRMLGGWIDFARANNLKERDVCVFELIQEKDLVFEVTIFRAYRRSVQGLCSKMRERALSKRQRGMEAAQNFKSENPPSFTATITPPNLKNRYMDVPALFWRQYMGEMRPMKLEDSEGREWKVNYFKLGSSIRIAKGWISFARANDVKEGDKCVFELIKWNRSFVFQVTIFAC